MAVLSWKFFILSYAARGVKPCGEGDFLNDADLDNSGWVDGGDLDALVGSFGWGCGQ
jgi:hypothetical protein